MDKNEYIIQKLALAKAQLELNYLELQHENEQLKKKLAELEGVEE